MAKLILGHNQTYPQSCGAAAVMTAIAENNQAPNFMSNNVESQIYLVLRDTQTLEILPWDIKLYLLGIRGKVTGSDWLSSAGDVNKMKNNCLFDNIARRFTKCEIIYDEERTTGLGTAAPKYQQLLQATQNLCKVDKKAITAPNDVLTNDNWMLSSVVFDLNGAPAGHWFLWRKHEGQIFVMNPDGGSNQIVSGQTFTNFFAPNNCPFDKNNPAASWNAVKTKLNDNNSNNGNIPQNDWVMQFQLTSTLNEDKSKNIKSAKFQNTSQDASLSSAPLNAPVRTQATTNNYMYLGLSMIFE